MVLSYVNPNPEAVVGMIKITPDNPSDIEQKFEVMFKPTDSPMFVTVAGAQGLTPSPLVMNPGRWAVSITIKKNMYLVRTYAVYNIIMILAYLVTYSIEL